MEQLGLCSLLAGLSGFTEQRRGVPEAPVPLEPDGRAAALLFFEKGGSLVKAASLASGIGSGAGT